MRSFSQKIVKIGINPCVSPPENVLKTIFKAAENDSGPIPVRGMLGGTPFKQTLVKYGGPWRLYINGLMLHDSGYELGDIAKVSLEYDPVSRVVPMHPKLKAALNKKHAARNVFNALAPYRRKEILRYLHTLTTDESLNRNIHAVIGHLMSKKATGFAAFLRNSR